MLFQTSANSKNFSFLEHFIYLHAFLPFAVELHHNIGFPEIHQQIFHFFFTLSDIAKHPLPFILWNIRWKTFLNFSLIHSALSNIRNFRSTDEILFTWEINYHKRQWWHIASTFLAWRCAQNVEKKITFIYFILCSDDATTDTSLI